MDRIRLTIRIFSLSLMSTLILLSPGFVASQEASPAAESENGPIFGVAPAGEADLSPFRLEIAAGQTRRTALAVSNEGTETIHLRTSAADIVTAVNGGYTVVPEGSAAPAEATWIALPADPYAVEPGQTLVLDITVTVPAGMSPGEYMAAVTTTDTTATDQTSLFQIATRKVNAVVITVPGEINAGFEVGQPVIEVADQAANVIVPITNTGNVRVKPTGSIVISTSAGDPVAEIPVAMGSVYAWDATTILAPLPIDLADGQYQVSVSLSDLATGATASLPATLVTTHNVSVPG